MAAMLDGATLTPEDRFHVEFALAKALEDAGEDAAAFAPLSQRQCAAAREVSTMTPLP